MCLWLVQYVHSALRFTFDEDGLMSKNVLFCIVVVILLLLLSRQRSYREWSERVGLD